MTTPITADNLLATSTAIKPERWASIRAELSDTPFGYLWIDYERLLFRIKDIEWQLRCPDDYMLPEEIPLNIAKLHEDRQLQPLYEEILVMKGWDRATTPADEKLPHCHICKYRMQHFDAEEDVCDDCREDIRRDMDYDERGRERYY